jgi:hypothetical protein
MTYWQSKGYIEAVFPAMQMFAVLKASGIAEKLFSGKGEKKGNPNAKKISLSELGSIQGFGIGEG